MLKSGKVLVYSILLFFVAALWCPSAQANIDFNVSIDGKKVSFDKNNGSTTVYPLKLGKKIELGVFPGGVVGEQFLSVYSSEFVDNNVKAVGSNYIVSLLPVKKTDSIITMSLDLSDNGTGAVKSKFIFFRMKGVSEPPSGPGKRKITIEEALNKGMIRALVKPVAITESNEETLRIVDEEGLYSRLRLSNQTPEDKVGFYVTGFQKSINLQKNYRLVASETNLTFEFKSSKRLKTLPVTASIEPSTATIRVFVEKNNGKVKSNSKKKNPIKVNFKVNEEIELDDKAPYKIRAVGSEKLQERIISKQQLLKLLI